MTSLLRPSRMREAKDWPRARTAVTLLEGRIEALLLPDGSVVAVVSNCVFSVRRGVRAARPGGRLAVAEVVAEGDPDLTTIRGPMTVAPAAPDCHNDGGGWATA